ncbi:MAG: hypothetical protein A3J79_14245 [Elusimicrobia bacterium RIFOXYB2_FULL_62_6]|nr:MAG: hypothetical protein A3J79_14245 [Elusimicrobia bacterium RIFOXYB2_FULL_62_6]
MAKKNILITGAGGFIGRNLAEFLGAKKDLYKVFAARHSDLELLDEKAVKTFIRAKKIDLVLHCSNTGGSRKTGYDSGATDVVLKNLKMFFNLARALPASARMINMGSGAEYGVRRRKIKETAFDAVVPADAYGFSKYVVSKYIEKADNILCLRIFGLYGKYEDYRFKFISNAIVKNLLGMPLVINQNVRFDYLYIADFLEIVERFIKRKPAFKHINITPTKSVDLLTAAAIINGIAAKKSPVKVLNPGLNAEYSADNSRLLQEVPGFRFWTYEEGIAELYKYYAANLDSLDLSSVRKDPYLAKCRTSAKGRPGSR